MATFLIFGITGNLSRHKILPALFKLYARKELNNNDFLCIGVGRKSFSKEEFHALISESIADVQISSFKDRPDIVESELSNIKRNFSLCFFYNQGELNDPVLYSKIKKDLDINSMTKRNSSVFCKLSLPPSMHEEIFDRLVDSKITSIDNFHLLIEKPFGHDAKSAQKLYNKITKNLDSKKLLLIDHYLGKESAIDLMNTRILGYMDHILNSRNIKQIEVRLFEDRLITGRGEFYDSVGALKDIGQNHLLQILAIAAADYTSVGDLNSAKSKFISGLSYDKKQTSIFGQYKGYLDEKNVSRDSKTETFFSVGLKSDCKKWSKTKFRLSSGKAMKNYIAEIVYTFNDNTNFSLPITEKNRSAYENVFLGAINDDIKLRADIKQIVGSWKIISEISKHRNSGDNSLVFYKKGSKLFDILKNKI